MTIPITTQEHLLRDTGELFDFGRCRICGGRFRTDVQQGHLDYHSELFEQYAPERRRLAAHRLDREEELGARMTCAVSGAPTVTRKQLDRHIALHGPEYVEAIATALDVPLELQEPKPRRNETAIKQVHRLYSEYRSLEKIVLHTGYSIPRIKRYLAMPRKPGMMTTAGAPETHATMRLKPPSTQGKGLQTSDTPTPVWNSVKKANLGMKIVGLAGDGMMPAAIADRLNKSDVVVRRYLREAVAAGLV